MLSEIFDFAQVLALIAAKVVLVGAVGLAALAVIAALTAFHIIRRLINGAPS